MDTLAVLQLYTVFLHVSSTQYVPAATGPKDLMGDAPVDETPKLLAHVAPCLTSISSLSLAWDAALAKMTRGPVMSHLHARSPHGEQHSTLFRWA